MSKNTAPATATFTFKFQGKTYTLTGTPLEVANAKRTVKAAEEKMTALAAKSVRRTRAPKGSKAPSEASIIRAWAREQGMAVGKRGRVHPDVINAYREAHADA